MNDDPSPLEPDQLDELLSASLDGELDAAARDRGLSVAEADARIRATPGADARRAALASARDLLAEPPEIDELLAARLRGKAIRGAEHDRAELAAERKHRRGRVVAGAGGIAAAIVAVVAIAAGVSAHSNTSTASSKSASAAAPLQTPLGRAAKPAASALGNFTDVHALAVAAVQLNARQGLHGAAGNSRDSTAFKANTKPLNGQSLTTTAPAAQSALHASTTSAPALKASGVTTGVGSGNGTKYEAARAGTSVAAPASGGCPAPAQFLGGTLVLQTNATLASRPVVVLVYASKGEHTVVIENTDCGLLTVQMLR